MSKSELLKYLLENNTNISIFEIAIGMVVSVLLAFFIYFIYKKTYSGVMYSKNFNCTLVLISIITTMVMMIIGSNLALSLGMVGALSIIRFRTAVKEPKDSAFIFWAIAVGIACGSGIYSIAILGSIVIAIILVLMNKKIFDETSYLLIIHANNDIDTDLIENKINNCTRKMYLKMKNMNKNGVDLTYEIKIDQKKCNELTTIINQLEGINSVNMVTYNGEIAG